MTVRSTDSMSAGGGTAYQIRVGGHLDDHWSGWLGGLAITRDEDGTSTLTGAVADQAQLHGVLAGLRDIGVPLLDLRSHRPAADAAVLDRSLHTDRLTLRPATADDADATWRFRQFDEVDEWLTDCPHDLDAYRALFADPVRLAATVVVELRRSGDVIGDVMLRRADARGHLEGVDRADGTQAELGWVLDPVSSRGYATEAVRELLCYCFAELGVRRVVASCFLDNHASWRLMERLGMRRESHAVRESLHRSGRWLDTVGYAILAEEWTTRRPDAPHPP